MILVHHQKPSRRALQGFWWYPLMRLVSKSLLLFLSILLGLNAQGSEQDHAFSDTDTVKKAPGGSAKLTRYRLANGRVIAFGPEIIVRLAPFASAQALKRRWKPRTIEPLSKQIYLLTFKAGSDIPSLCDTLAADPMILYAQPNIHSKKQLR